MSNPPRTKVEVLIPNKKYVRIEQMADDRDMTVSEFILDLLEIGLISLKSNPPRLNARATLDRATESSLYGLSDD